MKIRSGIFLVFAVWATVSYAADEGQTAVRQLLFDQARTLIDLCHDMVVSRTGHSEASVRSMCYESSVFSDRVVQGVLSFCTQRVPLSHLRYQALKIQQTRIRILVEEVKDHGRLKVDLEDRVDAYHVAVAYLEAFAATKNNPAEGKRLLQCVLQEARHALGTVPTGSPVVQRYLRTLLALKKIDPTAIPQPSFCIADANSCYAAVPVSEPREALIVEVSPCSVAVAVDSQERGRHVPFEERGQPASEMLLQHAIQNQNVGLIRFLLNSRQQPSLVLQPHS